MWTHEAHDAYYIERSYAGGTSVVWLWSSEPYSNRRPEGKTADSYLDRLCWQMANERYGVISADVGSQVKYKLNLTKRLGLSGHFLIVWDIMEHAKRSGVTAQGRGLAANSIAASVSGITKVDPIRHNLLLGLFLLIAAR